MMYADEICINVIQKAYAMSTVKETLSFLLSPTSNSLISFVSQNWKILQIATNMRFLILAIQYSTDTCDLNNKTLLLLNSFPTLKNVVG